MPSLFPEIQIFFLSSSFFPSYDSSTIVSIDRTFAIILIFQSMSVNTILAFCYNMPNFPVTFLYIFTIIRFIQRKKRHKSIYFFMLSCLFYFISQSGGYSVIIQKCDNNDRFLCPFISVYMELICLKTKHILRSYRMDTSFCFHSDLPLQN